MKLKKKIERQKKIIKKIWEINKNKFYRKTEEWAQKSWFGRAKFSKFLDFLLNHSGM
jgi:hypothetical protein